MPGFLCSYQKIWKHRMQRLFKLLFLSVILGCQGCQMLSQYLPHSITPEPLEAAPDLTAQLFSQGMEYEKLTRPKKKDQCKSLKQSYKNDHNWQDAWLLAYSSNNEYNCTSIKEKLRLLKLIQTTPDLNPQLLWLNNNQINLLNKLQKLQSKVNKFQRKNYHLKKQLNEAEIQLQQVISKIQALKEIETNINKKLDDEHSNGH